MPDDFSREEIERIAEEKAERVAREAAERVARDALREPTRRMHNHDDDYGRWFAREEIRKMAQEIAAETEKRIVERLLGAGINLAEPQELSGLLSYIKSVRSGASNTFKIFLGALALAASTWLASVLPRLWKS